VVARTRYVVPCRVKRDAFEILRVFHTSRRSPKPCQFVRPLLELATAVESFRSAGESLSSCDGQSSVASRPFHPASDRFPQAGPPSRQSRGGLKAGCCRRPTVGRYGPCRGDLMSPQPIAREWPAGRLVRRNAAMAVPVAAGP
jgi:hypothetical protein